MRERHPRFPKCQGDAAAGKKLCQTREAQNARGDVVETTPPSPCREHQPCQAPGIWGILSPSHPGRWKHSLESGLASKYQLRLRKKEALGSTGALLGCPEGWRSCRVWGWDLTSPGLFLGCSMGQSGSFSSGHEREKSVSQQLCVCGCGREELGTRVPAWEKQVWIFSCHLVLSQPSVLDSKECV